MYVNYAETALEEYIPSMLAEMLLTEAFASRHTTRTPVARVFLTSSQVHARLVHQITNSEGSARIPASKDALQETIKQASAPLLILPLATPPGILSLESLAS